MQTIKRDDLALARKLSASLKLYIGLSCKAIQGRVIDVVHFDYTESYLADLQLGRLLSLFRKQNSNKALQARVTSLTAERNHIAHRALLVTLGPLYDRSAVEEKYIEYSILEDELVECLQAVNAESQALKKRAKSAI